MKFWILSLLLLSSLVLHSQTPATQVNVESRFLEVNKDWMKELGITFGGGLAAGKIGQQQQFGLASLWEVGVEAEPLHNLFINPSLGLMPFVSQSEFWKQRINNIALAIPAVIAQDNKPVNLGIGAGPIFTFAFNETVNYGNGNETFPLNDYVNPFNIGIQVLPQIRIRSNITDVIIKGGTTVLLGGLYESSGSTSSPNPKPILGHLSILAKFFANRNHQRERDELLILVRPSLVDPED